MSFKRRRLSPKQREALWLANQYPEGSGGICNMCPFPILPGRQWDESHEGAPHALGGTRVGIAHRKCNRRHGATVVVPMIAKMKRQRKQFLNITGDGLGQNPLPGGRDDRLKKRMDGTVVLRATGERV